MLYIHYNKYVGGEVTKPIVVVKLTFKYNTRMLKVKQEAHKIKFYLLDNGSHQDEHYALMSKLYYKGLY